jgi:lipopolysaccharide/colanic/teichoic acid biosynthesis glycosyltransferase
LIIPQEANCKVICAKTGCESGDWRKRKMPLLPWLRKPRIKFAGGSKSRDRFPLDAHDFRREATRERVRADRSNTHLAILVIDLPADRRESRDFAFLCNVLSQRLRITDTAGQLPDGRVAVLFPDTRKDGAWKVASDICDHYPLGHDRPDCEVFLYPDESVPFQDDSQPRAKQPAESRNNPLESLFANPTPMLKRGVDIAGAIAGLIACAPLLVILAALIKLTSRGPVFYSQWREGHGGRLFRIHKFRTMCADAHQRQSSLRAHSVQDGPAFKMRHDPRTTWIGKFLRRTSLDELPQFWNVLIGEMSLVGPRPLPTHESVQCLPWQRQRLLVVPGLTCIWQVKGRSTVTFVEWMRMDLQYVRHRSMLCDLQLLLATGPSIFLTKGPR